MSSDSSSDEDEKNRFAEAAVTAKDVFSRKSIAEAKKQASSQKADSANLLLDISADCQKYLAKSLQNSLDRQLREVQVETKCYEPDSISDSSIELTDAQDKQYLQQPRKKHKHASKTKKISDDMLAAVAVTPDWVLSHSGIAKPDDDDAPKQKKSKKTS